MINQNFRDFISQNIQRIREACKTDIEEREAFLRQYPLSRVKELTVEEYCLGTEQSRDSLSYFMEFGKTGFGIGGGSSKKHGVYYNKGNECYVHGTEKIMNMDDFWPEFREELYRFLVLSGESESALPLENYPLLQGMAMVLTKYLSLYYPEKYLAMGSYHVLKNLMNTLGYPYDESMKCHQLNFELTRHLKTDYPELKDEDGTVLGDITWQYIDGYKLISGRTDTPETEKGPGLGDEGVKTVRYWLYSPGDNASIWDECYDQGIMAIGWDAIGDLTQYHSKDAMKQAMKESIDPNSSFVMGAHATWQFVHIMRPGDIVFAKKGRNLVIGRGIVESDYIFDSSRLHYRNVRKVRWTDRGEWPHPGSAVMKTMTDITPYTEYVAKLNDLFVTDSSEETEEQAEEFIPYTHEDFLRQVYMDQDQYTSLVELVRTKKNVILQGAPGVGKTYAAKRLAYSMMGVKDPNRVMMIQFHQSYSYEDFIMGFRPAEQGFVLRHGAFYNFCKAAEIDSENDYFFIIDEINRGNLSKIFGELFMLLEADKRGIELQLLYSDEKFSIPENVYIIGMMNTADRSLAMMDFALRRRFGFFEMKPGFDSDQFQTYRQSLASKKYDKLIGCVESLNTAIAADDSLGEGFCIGHSYFCNLKEVTDRALSSIVEFELIPLLKEYWFDEPVKVKNWASSLRSAIK